MNGSGSKTSPEVAAASQPDAGVPAVGETAESTARRLLALERELRCYRWGLALLMLLVALPRVAPTVGPSRASAQEAGAHASSSGDPVAIYGELHDRSHRAIGLLDQSIQIGAPNPGTAGVIATWSLRMLGTELYRIAAKSGGVRTTDPEVYLAAAVGPPDPERLKAFREHVSRMKEWEERFRPLMAKRYVTQTDYLAILARRLEAEAWEARELSKPAK